MKINPNSLTALWAFPLLSVAGMATGSNLNQPNIVIIFADDFGYGDLSCYGATKIHTPVTDKIASAGIRFLNGYVVSSLCSPSRYSLLTGRYAWRTHLRSGVLKTFAPPLIEEDRLTLASMLRENGYFTACVGKWHLGFNWELTSDAPDDAETSVFNAWGTEPQEYIDFNKPVKGGPVARGFDYFFGISGANNMMPFVYIENEMVVAPPSIPNNFGTRTLRAENWDVRYLDQTFARKATWLIDEHFGNSPDKPLFLYFPVSAIHRPCLPTITKGMSQAGMRGDLVVEFDLMVGQIVDALERNGVLENTLLIITSDNGPQPGDPYNLVQRFKNRDFGDEFDFYQPYFDDYLPQFPGNGGVTDGWLTYGHDATAGLMGFKSDSWEGGLRVPFIVHWPQRIRGGQVDSTIVCTVDIMATIAEILDLHLSHDQGEDSYSFLPIITGESAMSYRKTLTMVSGRTGSLIIRNGDWKYIEGLDKGVWDQNQPYQPNEYFQGADFRESQLYNLREDPFEWNNLIDINQGKVTELKELMREVVAGIRKEN